MRAHNMFVSGNWSDPYVISMTSGKLFPYGFYHQTYKYILVLEMILQVKYTTKFEIPFCMSYPSNFMYALATVYDSEVVCVKLISSYICSTLK